MAYPVVRKATLLQIQLLKLAKLSALAFNTEDLKVITTHQNSFDVGARSFSDLYGEFKQLDLSYAFGRSHSAEAIRNYDDYVANTHRMLSAKIALLEAKKQVQQEVSEVTKLVDEIGASLVEIIYFPVPPAYKDEMELTVGQAEQADRIIIGIIKTAQEIQRTHSIQRLDSALDDFNFIINDAMRWFDRSASLFKQIDNKGLTKNTYANVGRLRQRLKEQGNLIELKKKELEQTAIAHKSLEAANIAVNMSISELGALLGGADTQFGELQENLDSDLEFGYKSIIATILILIFFGARHFKSMLLAIQKKIDDLATLNQLSQSLATIEDQSTALESTLKRLCKKTGLAEGAAFLYLEENTYKHQFVGAENDTFKSNSVKKNTIQLIARYPSEQSENNKLAEIDGAILDGLNDTKKTIFIANTAKAQNRKFASEGSSSQLSIPLIDEGALIGVLHLLGKPNQIQIEDSDFELFSSIASGLVVTLKNIGMRKIIEEHNRTLEVTVRDRTAALKQKGDDINSMLINLHQGLFTVTQNGLIHPEYAPFLEEIFETYCIANQRLTDFLFRHSPLDTEVAQQFENVILSTVGKDQAVFDLYANQLVKKMALTFEDKRTKNIVLTWDPIVNESGIITKLLVTVQDVTEYHKAEEQKGLLAAIFKSSSEPIAVFDSLLYIKAVNSAFTELMKCDDESLVGDNLALVLERTHDGAYFDRIRTHVEQEGSWEGEIQCKPEDSADKMRWLTITPIGKSTLTESSSYLGSFSDIVQRQKVEDELRYLANYDALTSLPNRRLFSDRLHHAVSNANRNKNKLALLFIDLDRFKHVNDSYGHSVGDALLVEVASRLKEALRESDTLCRLGGDEFTVLIENLPSKEVISTLADKLVSRFIDPFIIDGRELWTGASIGISVYPDDGNSVETLMINADVAMYRAKKSSQNYCFFEAHMNETSGKRIELENDLHKALSNNELFLVYQPKVDLVSERITGAEVLLRWKHPILGIVSPDQFIPLAEETGLIIPIGQWVLETACHNMDLWQQQGLPPISLAVNVSAKQFESPNFATVISRILGEADLQPELLELELTESLLMDTESTAISTLTELKAIGVKLSIDDFGTGYSSLQYLSNFPIDYLKIDRSFVMGFDVGGKSVAIIRAIINMALGLDLKVIAEGVEKESQARLLKQFGCHYAQGYYYSRPLKEEDFVNQLDNMEIA